MEFALSPELEALQAEAREVGLAASERAEVPEDTWITGHDREFAEELGKRGWLGMTWPVEHGGGRSILERHLGIGSGLRNRDGELNRVVHHLIDAQHLTILVHAHDH